MNKQDIGQPRPVLHEQDSEETYLKQLDELEFERWRNAVEKVRKQRTEAANTDFRAAFERFQRDLPELLKTKFGRWVVYTPQGNGPELEGESSEALYRQCAARGLRPGHFAVERVLPDPPPLEMTGSWFVDADQ